MKYIIAEKQGNLELVNRHKTAFLSSRQVSPSIILKCYDWAIEQRNGGKCVISGFHSQIEKDVFGYLLKGEQPIIMALARGLKKRIEPELKKPLENNRLLIITPFKNNIKRASEETCRMRNKMMMEIADEIVIGYARPGGMLEELVNEYDGKKPIRRIG
jgi:predicted Rossmann fold nucleotide-binding protein DprA/Smf involved in DNA uptake